MRSLVVVMLLAGCGPTLPMGSNGPGPANGPVLRDLGSAGGMGARRIQIELPAPGHVLVITGHGRNRLELVALSVSPDRQLPAGRHSAVALPGADLAGSASVSCSNTVLYMQAAFPGPSGHLPLAALSDPPLPAASGPTPVMVEVPLNHECSPRHPSPRLKLYLLTASQPIGPRIAQAAIDGIPPGTPAPEAARLLAGALGASLTPLR